MQSYHAREKEILVNIAITTLQMFNSLTFKFTQNDRQQLNLNYCNIQCESVTKETALLVVKHITLTSATPHSECDGQYPDVHERYL